MVKVKLKFILCYLFSHTMLTANELKRIKQLADKKFRHDSGLFVAEGEKICSELIHSGFEVEHIYALQSWIDKLDEAEKNKIENKLTLINEKELERMSQLKQPNKVLAVAKLPAQSSAPDFKNRLTLLLDDIHDPGNLGTIIRTADWFGVSSIVCSETTVDVFNSKVVQASMGSVFRVNIYYANLDLLLSNNKAADNIPVYTAHLDGNSIYKEKLPLAALLLLGNESRGVAKELEKYSDKKISIPFHGNALQKADSLNAAIATGIILAEWRRQVG